jgi:hypothetical protein
MGECKLNHSLDDVRKKLDEQSAHLPAELYQRLHAFLNEKLTQTTLNEVFHLLKKYDLAGAEERDSRNAKISAILDGSTA